MADMGFRRILLTVALLVGACHMREGDGSASPARQAAPGATTSTPGPQSATARKEVPMHDVVSDSRSYLLRATHVVLVRIEAAKAGNWAPNERGVVRTVEVEARLEAIFKGKLGELPGNIVRAALVQFGTGTSRIAGVPGAWSHRRIEAGSRFVVISVTRSENAAEVLLDPACQLALPAEDALVDVELAAQAEGQALDVWRTVELAAASAPRLGVLFPEYLWGRFGAAALVDGQRFEPIAKLLEQRSLAPGARATLVSTLVSAVTSPEPLPTGQVARLAISFFRLLAMPEAARLHDNLVGTYLPNLIGLAGGVELRASGVFHDRPADRGQAERALRAYKGSEPAAPLLEWLKH
jgi:hypothetical protein